MGDAVRVALDCTKVIVTVPDIEDRAEREQWIFDKARTLFEADGRVLRTLVLRAGARGSKPIRLVIIVQNIPYELGHLGPLLATGAAKFFRAQQLYLLGEFWAAPESAAKIEPRHHAERRECLMVIAEDPYMAEPVRSWSADITREKDGRGVVGDWAPLKGQSGRLAYLLPPEAYLAAGKPVPVA